LADAICMAHRINNPDITHTVNVKYRSGAIFKKNYRSGAIF